MSRPRPRRLALADPVAAVALAAAVVAAVVLAGCGGGAHHTARRGASTGGVGLPSDAGTRPGTLAVFASLPLHGPTAGMGRAVLEGIELAWAQARHQTGPFRIALTILDDSTPVAATGADPARTAANARLAVADSRTVLYLGELDAAASEISLPILNQAGIPQIGPASGYVGLTTGGTGAAAGDPSRLYPLGVHTFIRLPPPDSVQALAALIAARHAGCSKLTVLSDGSLDAAGLSALVQAGRSRYDIAVSVADTGPGVSGLGTAVAAVRRADSSCVLLAASSGAPTLRLAGALAAAIPHVRILGSNQLCTASFTSALPGDGVSGFSCLSAVPNLADSAPGRAFLTAVRRHFGITDPDLPMALGYEAMRLGLAALNRLGARAADREAVLGALLATQTQSSVFGPYDVERSGDSTLGTFSLYTVGRDGRLSYASTITP